MTQFLYNIKLPPNDHKEKLYIDAERFSRLSATCISITQGINLDLGTYFNAFSLKKWIQYTSINVLGIEFEIEGEYFIEIYGVKKNGCKTLWQSKQIGNFIQSFDRNILLKWLKEKNEILGIIITAKSEQIRFYGGRYVADFLFEKNINIGVTFCTYKREEYLKKNIVELKKLCVENSHFNILVIDNGRTLETRSEANLKIIPNLNYGGSGGFARGLIEQVQARINTYILLMDDDIEIEITSLERLYSFVTHLKEEFEDRMIAGSMLRMDLPTMQFENSAYWGKIRMRPLGRGFDLTDKRYLFKNDNLPYHKNKYAAWWFCCIPLKVIERNGYPLPVFIKGDDMEYGIRNNKDIITMNGIGVWHEPFLYKVNPVVNYFNDRNMLILNHYVDGGSRWTFAGVFFARLVRRLINAEIESIKLYELALQDYSKGFSGITAIGSDEKFEQIKSYRTHKSLAIILINIFWVAGKEFFYFSKTHKEYLFFRKKNLKDAAFWTRFLRLEDKDRFN